MKYDKGLLSNTGIDRSNLICLLLLVAYLLPLIILRENSYISIYDNLDSFFIYGMVLKQSGTIFSSASTIVPNIMNGIPRSFYPSGINIYMLFIYLFDNILNAYILNAVLVHFLAYIGMYRLLNIIDSKEKSENAAYINFLKAFVSLCFAILPYQTNYGLSIAGVPLVVSAYIGLLTYSKGRLLNYLIIALFPLYCINIFITPFLLTPLFLFGVYSYVKHKNYYYNHFIYALVLIVVLFIISDYQILYSVFGGHQVISHRNDFQLDKFYPSIFSSYVITMLVRFIFQTYFPHYCLQLGVVIALVILLITQKRIDSRLIKILLLFNFLICLFWALHDTCEFQAFKNKLGVLRGYHINRFSFLLPASWYVIFFFTLKEIYEKSKKIVLCGVLIAIQISIILLGHLQVTMVGKRVLGYNVNTEKDITYNQFFSPALFTEIKQYIHKPTASYRIACVGFFSSVALYNGFYTLDNYQNNYPLDYKIKFRKVIANELAKSEMYRKDFDYWGHYCFIRSSEIPFKKQGLINKTCNYKINNLDINTEALKELNCKYIFSAVEIRNYEQLHLKFLKSFESEDSPWRIYVYLLL